MTEQGLGQIGGQPQQAPEEFTVDTAGRKNSEIVDKVRAASSSNSGKGLGTLQVDTTVPQQLEPTMQPQGLGMVDPAAQSMQIDQDAIVAVRNGQVDPMEVMNDPRVSGDAKAVIQGMMA